MNINDNLAILKPEMIPIGLNIQRLRKIEGTKQETLALAIGIYREQLSAIENGKRSPNIEIVQKIADYFNVPISELFRDTNKMNKKQSSKINTKGMLPDLVDFVQSHEFDLMNVTKEELQILANIRWPGKNPSKENFANILKIYRNAESI